MERKELTKTFRMISNLKNNPSSRDLYSIFQRFKGQGDIYVFDRVRDTLVLYLGYGVTLCLYITKKESVDLVLMFAGSRKL